MFQDMESFNWARLDPEITDLFEFEQENLDGDLQNVAPSNDVSDLHDKSLKPPDCDQGISQSYLLPTNQPG